MSISATLILIQRQIQLNRFNPHRIARDVTDSGTDLFQLLKEIPGEVREILGMVKKGKVKIEFEHKGLEPMYSTNDRISNRLSFAIVLASLVIGSALIVLSDIPPKWYGIPVIGLSGFLSACIDYEARKAVNCYTHKKYNRWTKLVAVKR